MYTNPFNRKHSTIRQVIDRFLHPETNNNRWGPKMAKDPLQRTGSNSSHKSSCSFSSKASKSPTPSLKFMCNERRVVSVGE